jgi:hypothetical protein
MYGPAANRKSRGRVVNFAEARASIRSRRAAGLQGSGLVELEQAFGQLDDRLIECGAAAASLKSAGSRPVVEWADPLAS